MDVNSIANTMYTNMTSFLQPSSAGVPIAPKIAKPDEKNESIDTSDVSGEKFRGCSDASDITGEKFRGCSDASDITGEKFRGCADASDVTGEKFRVVCDTYDITGEKIRGCSEDFAGSIADFYVD